MIEGVKFHPQRFFTVESFIEFQTFNTYKINIIRPRSIQLCLNTKKKALSSNLKSKFLYDLIFNFFENEALVEMVYLKFTMRVTVETASNIASMQLRE